MSSWGYTAITLAAFFSLLAPCLVAVAEAHEAIALHGDELPAFVGESPMTASRSLSAQDTKLHTSALHQTAQSNATDAASLSGSYTLRGIKPGLSATCYGQPCSASACYPAALVTVKRFVNYVNVTAIVQFSWRYQVQSSHSLKLTHKTREATLSMLFLADFLQVFSCAVQLHSLSCIFS